MANAALWEKRVEQWRASGLSSKDFCDGQDFTAGALRYWAHQMQKRQVQSDGSPPQGVRLARVVQAPTAAKTSRASRFAGDKTSSTESALLLKVQGARIAVRSGFDEATLAAVLEVLDQRACRTRRP